MTGREEVIKFSRYRTRKLISLLRLVAAAAAAD